MGVGIVTSKTRLLQNRRPSWPFCLDEDSHQAVGLVGWWPMSGCIKGSARDLSYGNINLANNGPTAVNDAEMGVVANFDRSSSQYLRGTGARIDNVPNTLSVWVRATSLPGYEKVLHVGDGYVGWYVQFGYSGALIRAAERSGSGERILYGPTSVTLDRWYLITAVFEALDNRHLYIDGGLYTSNTTSGTQPSPINYSTIGRHADVNGDYLDGAVADARVYGVALSADDIAALYDPASRWDLYYPLGRTRYVIFGGGSGTTLSRTLETASAASAGEDIAPQRMLGTGHAAAAGEGVSLRAPLGSGSAEAAGQQVGTRQALGAASVSADANDVAVDRPLATANAASVGLGVDVSLGGFTRTLETADAAAAGLDAAVERLISIASAAAVGEDVDGEKSLARTLDTASASAVGQAVSVQCPLSTAYAQAVGALASATGGSAAASTVNECQPPEFFINAEMPAAEFFSDEEMSSVEF